MSRNFQDLLKRNILNEETFVRATFSGQQEGKTLPWTKVVVRPILLKEQRHLQFSYFDAFKDITKNYAGHEAEAQLDDVLNPPFQEYLRANRHR